MKKRLVSITVLAIVLLLGTCFEFGNPLPQPRRALSQGPDLEIYLPDFLTIVGITPAQMARVTVANLSAGRQASFQVLVFDRNGTRVFISERIEVPATAFRQLDVSYDDFGMDFEAGTGRKQGQLVVVFPNGLISNTSMGGQKSPNLVGSLELIDVATGKTTIHQPWRRILQFATSDENVGTR